MRHILESENFLLQIQLNIFESDISFSSNAIMNVEIKSFGFQGIAELDIDIKEFARFANNLQKIYDSLNGSAKVEEPYGVNQYIEFFGDGKGHVWVKGHISQRFNDFDHELVFSNEIDQTQLKDFAKELYEKYSKYSSI